MTYYSLTSARYLAWTRFQIIIILQGAIPPFSPSFDKIPAARFEICFSLKFLYGHIFFVLFTDD